VFFYKIVHYCSIHSVSGVETVVLSRSPLSGIKIPKICRWDTLVNRDLDQLQLLVNYVM